MHTIHIRIVHSSFDAQEHFHLLHSLDGTNMTARGAGMLAVALKVNQSLQNLRSEADAYVVHIWCTSFLPGYKP